MADAAAKLGPMSEEAARALAALADPTRRAIFEAIRGAPASVKDISIGLVISSSSVSQHLKVLRKAGLVTGMAIGIRHIYKVDQHGLGPLRSWLGE